MSLREKAIQELALPEDKPREREQPIPGIYGLLNREDLIRAISLLPEKLVFLLKKNQYLGLRVAGGFLRSAVAGEPISDVDVFASDEAGAKGAAGLYYGSLGGPSRKEIFTDNAITVLGGRLPVQFITVRSYPSLRATLESFDFTIAQAGIEYRNDRWYGLRSNDFYEDLAAKRLRYVRPADNIVGGSLLRVLKFVKRGYYLAPEEFAKILAHFYQDLTLGKPGPTDLDRPCEKLALGVDVEHITKELREVDPLGRWAEEVK